jgi:ABC-type dipeptide/oligopeptide/nickel transport system permease component
MDNVFTYKSNWWGFIGKRIILAVVIFLIITIALYIAFHGIWGPDNAVNILMKMITFKELPEMEILMDKYTSGEGRLTQYFQWLGDFFTGGWGYSIVREHSTFELY